MEHGAPQVRENVVDDVKPGRQTSFPQSVAMKKGKNRGLFVIVYALRAHRDKVNEKVMQDPRIAGMSPETMPFDVSRMIYGGFEMMGDL